MAATNKTFLLVRDTDSEKGEALKRFTGLLGEKLKAAGLDATTQVVGMADAGIYFQGLAVKVQPAGLTYVGVQDADADAIVESLRGGKPVERLLFKPVLRQMRVVLRNCGDIDPESFEEYVAKDGYQGLKKALLEMTPERVIEELKTSGLRGRGGAGFPTWMKWNFARGVASDVKYMICNGDEGDPGAYMDRSVLEGDPHSVVEGMIIAGYAIGAAQGYFYIRAEYPLAIERIRKAIDQAYAAGLLGQNILGGGFSFDLDIRLGAGAFVCGEETALIASIEGRRGTPVPRPPYPAVKGLWGKPTVINNVETLANVSAILARGGKWFSGIGMPKSTGTKVFALTGKVKNSGLIEVPMGSTLRDIVMHIGGGTLSGGEVKGIQTGGPSGGVIPQQHFDTPVSYEGLQALGSIMGSGGMIVMDNADCMVDISKFYMRFCVDESCGKCAPCRLGGYQMLNILTKISEGRGQMTDIAQLKKIALAMRKASLCGLGQSASNPTSSTITYFEEEYRMHIVEKKCPAGKCDALLTYRISAGTCVRCGACAVNCPVNAISGSKAEAYSIHEEKCIKCGRCYEVCKFGAVLKG